MVETEGRVGDPDKMSVHFYGIPYVIGAMQDVGITMQVSCVTEILHSFTQEADSPFLLAPPVSIR